MSIDITGFLNDLKRSMEVSKRFAEDAMPARQMAIDADLKAGRITEEEAKERRKYLLRIENDGEIPMIKEELMARIIFPTLKEIAEANGFNLYKSYVVSTDILGKFGEWSFKAHLRNKKWEYLRISLKFISNGKNFLYGLLSDETMELEKSKLNKHLPKIKEDIKEEIKKYGYESENTHFLIYKETLWKMWEQMWELWENWENTKVEEFAIEIENMKREFESIIKELSEIGERLEGKLREI